MADKDNDKSVLAGESESIADKYFVCTECLVEGNVQSFVDLFYLVFLPCCPPLVSAWRHVL